MKKILITGANSYIGTSFEKYIRDNYPDEYIIDTVDMKEDHWREMSFARYDSVFHVAGIAHQKETKKNAPLYYTVNRDLAIETAKKAKQDGVKQFIYLSSMSVYGMDTGVITKDTVPNPKSNYGMSKLEAEKEILKLQNASFKLAILRPPMVYGDGCKGNYQTIVKLIKKFPVFPRVKNQRSMVHIEVLSNFVKNLIDSQACGLYFPQNEEYIETSKLAKEIAVNLNKKVYFSALLGICVSILKPFSKTARKAFGSLIYKV